MIPQKSYKFTHEFVKKVLYEQKQILESIQKEGSYAELAKGQCLNFWSSAKGLKKRLDKSIRVIIFKNLQGDCQ